ncbi:MAG TPA: RHS repeat-associated core domain-containing protein [Thermoanaerobaculia bacterium]|nr:RHS repeat-associated core domain-containing protein [Thermoanaerobaculia bacterium]
MRLVARLALTCVLLAATAIAQPSSSSATYRYDANGNLVGKDEAGVRWEYVYDVLDRLVEVRRDGATVQSYRYDYQDRRIEKSDAEGTVRYLWDEDRLVAELDASGRTIVRYSHSGDRLTALDHAEEGQLSYLLDALGSPVSLSRRDGTLAVRYGYDAWGVPQARAGDSENPVLFTGHLFDEVTGLYYARARYYDPQIGRLLSVDPFGGTTEEPRSLHPYVYAYANPTTYLDRDGRCVGALQQSGFCQAIARFFEHQYAGDPLAVADRDEAIHHIVMDGRRQFREEHGRKPLSDEAVATIGASQFTAGFEEIDTSGRIEPDHLEWSIAGVGVSGRIAYGAARAGGAPMASAVAAGARQGADAAAGELLGISPGDLGSLAQAVGRPRPNRSAHSGYTIITESAGRPGVDLGDAASAAADGSGFASRAELQAAQLGHRTRPGSHHSRDQPRDALGRFGPRSSTGQLVPGSAAVDDFIASARAQGYDVVGREVTVHTPFGNRRYDVVLRDPQTRLAHAVEIKSTDLAFARFDGPARKQFAADRWVNQHGATGVGTHEGLAIRSVLKVLWEPPP